MLPPHPSASLLVAELSRIQQQASHSINSNPNATLLNVNRYRHLQEHDLLELMDQSAIGTDASMAAHVSMIR